MKPSNVGGPLKLRLYLKNRIASMLWKDGEVLSPKAGMRNPASRVDALCFLKNSLIKSSNKGLERNKVSEVTEQAGELQRIWVRSPALCMRLHLIKVCLEPSRTGPTCTFICPEAGMGMGASIPIPHPVSFPGQPPSPPPSSSTLLLSLPPPPLSLLCYGTEWA